MLNEDNKIIKYNQGDIYVYISIYMNHIYLYIYES